jgi:hypothetical protein
MARSQQLHQRPNTFAQTTFAIVRFSLATLRRTIHTDNFVSGLGGIRRELLATLAKPTEIDLIASHQQGKSGT